MKLGKQHSIIEFKGKNLVVWSPQKSKAGASILSYGYNGRSQLRMNRDATFWYSLQEHNTFTLGLNEDQEDENLYLVYAPDGENAFILRGNNSYSYFVLPRSDDNRLKYKKFYIEESKHNGSPMLILKPKLYKNKKS